MSLQVYPLLPSASAEHSKNSPQLCRITVAQYAEDWSSALQAQSCARFLFITDGQGTIQTADKSLPVATNDVVTIAANIPCAQLSQISNPLCFIALDVDRLPCPMGFGDCSMFHLTGRQAIQLSACLELLVQEAQEQEEGWDTACQNLLEIFIRRLSRRRNLCPSAPDASACKARQDCELVRRYIDNHFKENLRLDDLAALVEINKYYLSHSFQREFGVSPISYLISRRIQESRYLLSSTDHTLSQIAHMLGFSSLSYFSQSFRRLEGISPMEYRRQCLSSTTQGGGA